MDPFHSQGGGSTLSSSTQTRRSFLILLALLAISCGREKRSEENEGSSRKEKEVPRTRFHLKERAYGYQLRIRKDPSSKKGQLYRLIENEQEAPASNDDATDIRIPVDRIACVSSTHAGMLLALKETDRIRAFPSMEYLYDKGLRRRMENGEIAAVGMQRSVNAEKLVSLKVGLVLDNGMDSGSKGAERVLAGAGIPTLDILAWKEQDPIARLKWLRVLGVLTGKKAKAEAIIKARKEAYDSIASRIPDDERKPKVLCNAPHKGTWHVPGGNSYMACMIRDAGGTQPWPENDATGGVPKSLEEVIAKGRDADIWLNPGSVNSLRELSAVDARLSRIEAYQNGSVYNNDRRKAKGGGNDHWESGIVHPELILGDLAQILHPERFPERELHFYRELPKERPR